ncbi:putative late blight resistance protein-like protein [Nymphaea thermarum]|nr:putative late blight resistance protein-like protein [Nymphaea thermarum]
MTIVIDTLVQTPISILLGDVISLLKEKMDLVLNAKDDLEVLQQKLSYFEKALKVTDHKLFFSNGRNRDLEEELKDVVYDTQDIIEGHQTTIALCRRDKHSTTSWNKVRKPWTSLCSCFKEHVSPSYKLANDIKNINQKLDKIKENNKMMAGMFGITPNGGEGPVHGEHDNPQERTYHMGVQPPIGREKDKKDIVKMLLSNDSTESSKTHKGGVSIISIVGKGGIGKTTLAKMVFKETEEHFGKRQTVRIWCSRYYEKCARDLEKTLNCSLSELCTQLRNELSKEKFLLVLDDVWELKWWEEEVEVTLMAGVMGSNILITSRNKDVSEGMRAYMYELQEFSFDQSSELFLKTALRGCQTQEDLVMHNVRDVGERIVRKCGGLPLVVKTVGSMMRTKKMHTEDWKFVEGSKIWEWKMPADSSSSSEISGKILPGVMLSYDDLPHYLRSCFVYCCIYPKDCEIKRERLIKQWVAHGFIEEKEGIDVEVTANQYIEDLIKRCLIDTHDTFYGTSLKLHDIFHDLALYIGGKEYSHAKHTHHLSLVGVQDAEVHKCNASGAANKLHTILVDGFSSDWPSVFIKDLTNFKWLRVLSLRDCEIDELPKSIEDLSLVKYLDLSWSLVRRLPSSIGRLYNLQTLDLSESRIKELPKEMGELCNLRHLGLKDTWFLEFIAEGLGKLTNLRTLHRFMVCEDKGKTRGCNINELKDLKKLKGELSIEGLRGGRVKMIDAKKVHLKERHELNEVKFYFKEQEDDRVDNASEERGLLEALEPPHCIESLGIYGYKGDRPACYLDTNYEDLRMVHQERCPSWATAIEIKSLEELEVSECPTLCALPSMPLLKSLEISYCDGLNTIGDMPALESLNVYGCEKLKTLANMPALNLLWIEGCEWFSDCGGLNTIGDLPALESLDVNRCEKLKTLASMPALELLEVKGCGRVKQVADDHMPALKRLKQLPTRLPSLEEVYVENSPNWESTFTSSPCLREAYFKNCPKMQTEGLISALSELMGHDSQATQLQKLSVMNCPSARLGWKLLEQLPNLIELKLDLKSAVLLPSPLPSEVSTFLPSLKTLDLQDNTNVDEVKWGRLPQWVWGLSQLEKLILRCFSEDITLGGQWQCLPKLKELQVAGFPNLKSLVDVNNITPQQQQNETTCPTNAQQQIACLSNLQSLLIDSCPALELPQDLSDRLGGKIRHRNI